MKNKFCLLIVFFLCISSLLPAGAQTLSEKDFQVLNMNDGLSDNDIHSVVRNRQRTEPLRRTYFQSVPDAGNLLPEN